MGITRRRKPKQQPAPRGLIRAGDRTMTFLPDAEEPDNATYPSQEEIEAALSDAPADLTWDWASLRLIPLFERGYGEGFTGDQMVNTVSHLGVGIGFGIDFGPMLGRVTQSMARRWEASLEQVEHAAFTHLAEAAASISRGDLQSVVHRGHFFRVLSTNGGWASSLILTDGEHLIRIFGTHDAIFTAPARNALLAFGPGTPERAVAEVTFNLESMDPNPLQLDPFVMEDGVIRWHGLEDDLVEVI
jgi:hypothetical protein